MEGMAGVVHLHQVMRGMPEYERSCRLMTAETNAAVAGARRAGATRFVVNDSHGDMRNFLLAELDDGVEVVSGADKPDSMGAGLDPTFEVAFFVGYHASGGSDGRSRSAGGATSEATAPTPTIRTRRPTGPTGGSSWRSTGRTRTGAASAPSCRTSSAPAGGLPAIQPRAFRPATGCCLLC